MKTPGESLMRWIAVIFILWFLLPRLGPGAATLFLVVALVVGVAWFVLRAQRPARRPVPRVPAPLAAPGSAVDVRPQLATDAAADDRAVAPAPLDAPDPADANDGPIDELGARLETLARLHAEGRITTVEYEAQRAHAIAEF